MELFLCRQLVVVGLQQVPCVDVDVDAKAAIATQICSTCRHIEISCTIHTGRTGFRCGKANTCLAVLVFVYHVLASRVMITCQAEQMMEDSVVVLLVTRYFVFDGSNVLRSDSSCMLKVD